MSMSGGVTEVSKEQSQEEEEDGQVKSVKRIPVIVTHNN